MTTTTTTSKFNTEITTILADKQKAIKTALSAPDFASKFDLISEQDLKTLRIDEIIKQMLQEKKEKLQVRIPSDLVRISDEMLKTVSIDEIVEQVLRKKKEELQSTLSPEKFALIEEQDYILYTIDDIIEKVDARVKERDELIRNEELKTARILKINEIKQQCNESTVCMALGMYTNDIKEHFNNFTDFTFVNDIALITNTAGTGFVNSIKYFRENFTAYAILKSNLNRKSDNLLYEYMVGLYLNTLNKRFPCFLETYGYYTYVDNSSELRLALQTIYETNIDKNLKIQKAIKTNLILEPLNYANVNNADTMDEVYINACGPMKQAILIQYFNNVMTFSDFLKANNVFDNDVFTEFIHILFQVYFPLAHLKDSFTHYDLHSSNVLLYKPAEKKYIEYHYHDNDGTIIIFKSKYMVKIIDYGRCFFQDDVKKFGSNEINATIKENYANCGGFRADYLNNNSTDLLLLYRIRGYNLTDKYDKYNKITKTTKTTEIDEKKTRLMKLFDDIKFEGKYNGRDNSYTPSHLDTTSVDEIWTVNDVYLRIKQLVVGLKTNFSRMTTELGKLHIYTDGKEMEYFPSKK